jgi:hypothetical protein
MWSESDVRLPLASSRMGCVWWLAALRTTVVLPGAGLRANWRPG